MWCVRPFEATLASPGAKDLLESSFKFAADSTERAARDFIGILVEILETSAQRTHKPPIPLDRIARTLANALPGFKGAASNPAELREMIGTLITIILAGAQNLKQSRG